MIVLRANYCFGVGVWYDRQLVDVGQSAEKSGQAMKSVGTSAIDVALCQMKSTVQCPHSLLLFQPFEAFVSLMASRWWDEVIVAWAKDGRRTPRLTLLEDTIWSFS